MKKKAFTVIWAIFMTVGLCAQTTTPNVSKRQNKQQQRIAEGVKSGQLNAKETARLEKQEQKIQQDKKQAKADGVVTPEEKAGLEREENKTSRRIYKQKHDIQTRK